MKIYISGPMTGKPEYNFPEFQKAKEYLQAKGFDVLSPHEAPEMESYSDYMRHDLKLLLECGMIAMLPEWGLSRGAVIESQVATVCGMEHIFLAKNTDGSFTILR